MNQEFDYSTNSTVVRCAVINHMRLQLHGAIYCADSFVLMLRYCVNLKAIRYESTSFNRIVADKLHRVIIDQDDDISLPTNTNLGMNI